MANHVTQTTISIPRSSVAADGALSNAGKRGMHSASGAFWDVNRDGMWTYINHALLHDCAVHGEAVGRGLGGIGCGSSNQSLEATKGYDHENVGDWNSKIIVSVTTQPLQPTNHHHPIAQKGAWRHRVR
jgi:hypothetical protein